MGKTGKKLFQNMLGSGKNESKGLARMDQPINEETLLATRGKSVDLVFVIDTTGSMSDKIKSLLETAAKFVDRFGRLQMDSRIAIVAFGDLNVKSDKIVATGFTRSLDTTKSSLQKIPRFSGGANRGESSLEALQKAMALDFRDNVVKVVLLITDEPANQNRQVKASDVIARLKDREMLTFVVSTPEKYYKEMAAHTGGKWYKISAQTDFTDLLEMFGDIASKVSETVADVYRIGDGRVSDYLRLAPPEKIMNWDADERQIPPMSAEMFSTLVTSRLRASKEVEILGGKGLQLKLKIRGQETTAQLERVYERYRANPEAVSPIIDLYIDNLVNGGNVERAGNQAFAEVRGLLLPRLMTAQQWMSKRDDGLRLVIRSLADDLGEGLVIDRGQEFEYVRLDLIPAWDIDSQSAFDAAHENLVRASANAPYSVNGEGAEMLLVDRSVNAAARVVLPERMAVWQGLVGGELVVGLPTHDLMLGFARTHPAYVELAAQVAEDAAGSPNGLLGTLLRVHQGALELLA